MFHELMQLQSVTLSGAWSHFHGWVNQNKEVNRQSGTDAGNCGKRQVTNALGVQKSSPLAGDTHT